MNPLKNLFSKVFEAPADAAPKEDAAFEWNPEEETVAPTSAQGASWKRADSSEAEPQTVRVDKTTAEPDGSLPKMQFESEPRVEAAPPTAPAPEPVAPPVVRVVTPPTTAELQVSPRVQEAADSWKRPAPAETKVQPEPVAAMAPAAPKNLVPLSDFEDIYRKAGIKSPVHGYGVERVYRLLTSRRLANMDRNVRRSALLTALDAAGVPASDVSQDAVLRRKALAAYEAEKALELQSLRSRNESRVEALQDTVETFTRQKQTQIERLAQGSTAAVRAQSDLEIRKRMEQDRLFRSLAYFVESLPSPSSIEAKSAPVTLRPSERFEDTVEMAPVPSAAAAAAIETTVAAVEPEAVEAEPPATSTRAVDETIRTDVGQLETAPLPSTGLEMALRLAAQEAKSAGWGQPAIKEDTASDAVDALRKLREGGTTENER